MSDLFSKLKAVCQNEHLLSLAVTIFNKNEVVAQAAFGVRKLGESTPITIKDCFHIGSNGKAMTATMIAELVENGRLSWQSTPQDIFPDWASSINPAFANITLLQLLSHQAGLPPFEEEEEFDAIPQFDGEPMQSRLNFAKFVLSQEPINLPGSEFQYSNASFTVATAMAEAVSNSPWETMLKTMILTPLGIKGGVGWPAKTDPNQPWGHVLKNDKIIPHDPLDDYELPSIIAPAGDVYVAFDDYTNFLQMNLKALAGEKTLLNPETVQFLHTPHGKAGLGWGIQTFEGAKVSVHTGSADTFFAIALLGHQNGVGISMVTNITWEVAEKPCVVLLKSLAQEYIAGR